MLIQIILYLVAIILVILCTLMCIHLYKQTKKATGRTVAGYLCITNSEEDVVLSYDGKTKTYYKNYAGILRLKRGHHIISVSDSTHNVSEDIDVEGCFEITVDLKGDSIEYCTRSDIEPISMKWVIFAALLFAFGLSALLIRIGSIQ